MRMFSLIFAAVLIGAIAWLSGDRIYMNTRPADPLLANWETYEADAFATAQANGEPIMIDVYASWCPTCKAQHQAFETFWDPVKFSGLRVFRVNFDSDRAFLKEHRVLGQSTLLFFAGEDEVERSYGETNPQRLEALIFSALGHIMDAQHHESAS